MAENINLKPITDVPAVEELPDGATVLINDNGAAKQIPANKIVAEPMIVNINANIIEGTPQFTCDKTFDEIKAASNAGKTFIFYFFENGQEIMRTNMHIIAVDGGKEKIMVPTFFSGNIIIYSDGTIEIG